MVRCLILMKSVEAPIMLEHYVKKILQARVYDVAIETPLSEARFMSKRLNNQVWIKREDLQPVYSFKIRGAYNKMAQLTEKEKRKVLSQPLPVIMPKA